MTDETTEASSADDPQGRNEALVMRCPNCGYTQQDAELHADHHLCRNQNPPWRKYFRSQAIAGNPDTMMYWVEYGDGKAADIMAKNIPDGALVSDVTFEHDKRTVRKSGNSFVAA